LNKGSCSRCNTPIEWPTALFCGGCRQVAYCGVKCQKEDWRYGSHLWIALMCWMTTFNVRSSRNISPLTSLRNNIVTNQKNLFLRHQGSISTQLFTCIMSVSDSRRFCWHVTWIMHWVMIEAPHTLHTPSRSTSVIYNVFNHLLLRLVVILMQAQPEICWVLQSKWQ
jgi:hypothetical protein